MNNTTNKKGLNKKLVGQIGEFLVCAELGRRGFIATPFAGNVPAFDVLAVDAQCRAVPIQVKANTTDSWLTNAKEWMNITLEGNRQQATPKKIENPELIYICVAVSEAQGGDQFYILRKDDLREICVRHYTEWMDKHDWQRPKKPDSTHLAYYAKHLLPFKDNWSLIEKQMNGSHPDWSLSAFVSSEESRAVNEDHYN